MESDNKNNQSNQRILASSLFQLCLSQSTGTVFILTSTNLTAQAVLKNSKVVAFSFENKNGLEALEAFRDSTFIRSQFIENYEFPLTSDAEIHCSDCLLNYLGYNEFLIEHTNTRKKQRSFKCMRTNLFDIGDSTFAI